MSRRPRFRTACKSSPLPRPEPLLSPASLNDAAARQPLYPAAVTLTDAVGNTTTTTTDSQGGFAFINMPAGVYSLTISAPPLGTYQLINDTYDPDSTSQLTALVSTEA